MGELRAGGVEGRGSGGMGCRQGRAPSPERSALRRFLRETLKMSNAEDLNRLTACSLVLLGHIFYVLGNHRVRPGPRGAGGQGPG